MLMVKKFKRKKTLKKGIEKVEDGAEVNLTKFF
jgi:hypothetical protein